MAKGLALSRRRLPAFLSNGFIRAYALVPGLTVTSRNGGAPDART